MRQNEVRNLAPQSTSRILRLRSLRGGAALSRLSYTAPAEAEAARRSRQAAAKTGVEGVLAFVPFSRLSQARHPCRALGARLETRKMCKMPRREEEDNFLFTCSLYRVSASDRECAAASGLYVFTMGMKVKVSHNGASLRKKSDVKLPTETANFDVYFFPF